MEKEKVKVLIDGMEYTLVTSESPEYVQRVAVYVDKKLTEIKKSNPELPNVMALMLLSVNLTDEHLKLLDSTDNMRTQISEYSKTDVKISNLLAEKDRRIKELENEIEKLKTSNRSGNNKNR